MEEFGLEMAAAGQRAILSAWDILEGMIRTAGLTTPFWRFTGYAGFRERDQDIPCLLYNLGCNGVGILPSIFGGKRIADFLNGRGGEPSLFDHPKIRERKAC